MLRPDTLIHERYRIVRLIASGGFGMVYEAIDERLNQRVALKQLVRVNERISKHFTNEARLLAGLNHPALPRVTDYFPDASGPFLVMDYVPGDDLATMLYDRNAPFPLDEVLVLASKLLDVLDYLHTREPAVIHRDIKPQNLKLRANGNVILLDFGLAKGYVGEALPSSAASSMTAFTRGFAPLEQVEGTGTDARSDLYSLGATLYCLLTNNGPPEAQIRLLSVMRNRPDPLIPAHLINSAVPEAISQVLQQTLELEMERRPSDAPTLQAMLRAAQTGTHPAPPRRAEPTEIHTPNETAQHKEILARYEAAVAFMVAQQWVKALQSLELVERYAPGYRDTHARLALVRQELDPGRTAPVRIEPVRPEPLHTEQIEQPRTSTLPQSEPVHAEPIPPLPIEPPRTSTPPALPATGRKRGIRLWAALGAATLLVVLVGGIILLSGGFGGIMTAFISPPAIDPAQQETAVAQVNDPDADPTTAPPDTAIQDPSAPLEQDMTQQLETAMAAFGRRGGLNEAIYQAQVAVDLDPENPEPHALLALFYMQRFDWNAVARESLAAIALDPNHAAAQSFLSQARREQGDFERALEAANTAIEIQPDLSLGYTSRALVYMALAEEQYDSNSLDTALSDAEQAIEEAGDENGYHQVEAYAAKASVLAARYNFTGNPDDIQQAIEEYRQAIGSHVELAWHYVNLGNILVTAGRYDDANTALDEAIERDPELYSSYEARGWLLYNQESYDEAIEQFTLAADLSVENPAASTFLGRGYAHHANAFVSDKDKQAELYAAHTDLARAIEIEPDEPWSWYSMGSILQDADDATAESTLRKAHDMFNGEVQLNSENASAYEGLGWTHWRLNELDEALAAFDNALGSNARQIGAYQGKAYVLNAQEGKSSACDVLAEGESELPDNLQLQNTKEELECY